jgi:uncharacterized membrane protein YgaE (UPF0421/DUF939 family)
MFPILHRVTLRSLSARLAPSEAGRRLRPRLLPIAQTALAAVLAYYVARLIPLDDPRPTFASIAAVICLGATYHQRGRRAVELTAGVVLGLTTADLLLHLIGPGPLQIAVMIVLAMAVAVVLRGSDLFVNEAAISGLILVSLVPAEQTGLTLTRPVEGLVGGLTALLIGAVVFAPNPKALVHRAATRVLTDLRFALGEVAEALDAGDHEHAGRALRTARGLDGVVDELVEAYATGQETVRMSPARRRSRDAVSRHVRSGEHLDFAVRNTRILARHALRYTRSGLSAPDDVTESVRQLAFAVEGLLRAHDDPSAAGESRRHALKAARLAQGAFELEPDLAVTEIIGQVRSTAVDLVRAADLLGDQHEAVVEAPTEELLAAAA